MVSDFKTPVASSPVTYEAPMDQPHWPIVRPLGRRWTASLKLEALNAVKAGKLTTDDLSKLYDVSVDEFEEWTRKFTDGGYNELKATRKPRRLFR